MFLSQVPTHAGAGGRRHRRSRSATAPARPAAPSAGMTARIARPAFTDDGARAIAGGAMDVVVEATGNPAVGISACPRGDRGRQACRHGQCRGRRAGRAAAGRGSAQGRRGLFAGLWRPAGADRRDGRLGARRRAFASSPPARAPNICRPITTSRRTASGAITA